MGSGTKNKKGKLMGDYTPTPEEEEAFMWCVRNGIRISPLAATRGNPTEWHIVIETNNKKSVSPESYGPGLIWKKLHEFFTYYYEKYRERI